MNIRWSLGTCLAMFIVGALVLALTCAIGCTDREQSCDVREQLDTTGNTKHCACVCDDDAQQCPMLASDPTRSAIPACWEGASSSEESTT